jgi:hypothetical protein
MGDTWPFAPPTYTTWDAIRSTVNYFTHNDGWAVTLAAIASAESSLDMTVVNDTPATGDYSVGAFQINYYNGLYAGRSYQFGTPRQLATGGIGPQVRAALLILNEQGFSAWSTYTSGAYRQYLHGYSPGTVIGGPTGPSPGPAPVAPAKDWSPWVARTAGNFKAGAGSVTAWTPLVRRI